MGTSGSSGSSGETLALRVTGGGNVVTEVDQINFIPSDLVAVTDLGTSGFGGNIAQVLFAGGGGTNGGGLPGSSGSSDTSGS